MALHSSFPHFVAVSGASGRFPGQLNLKTPNAFLRIAKPLGWVGIQQVIKVRWEKRVFSSQELWASGAPESPWAKAGVPGRGSWRVQGGGTTAALSENKNDLRVLFLGFLLKKGNWQYRLPFNEERSARAGTVLGIASRALLEKL